MKIPIESIQLPGHPKRLYTRRKLLRQPRPADKIRTARWILALVVPMVLLAASARAASSASFTGGSPGVHLGCICA